MEPQLRQFGPVEVTQVRCEMAICVRTVQEGFRRQWTKSTLVAKTVDGEFCSIAITWGIKTLRGGTEKKRSVSPQRKPYSRRWEIPLINLSLALSEIMSACHKSAILFSKTPYNPELDKQHFYQMHKVLASGN